MLVVTSPRVARASAHQLEVPRTRVAPLSVPTPAIGRPQETLVDEAIAPAVPAHPPRSPPVAAARPARFAVAPPPAMAVGSG